MGNACCNSIGSSRNLPVQPNHVNQRNSQDQQNQRVANSNIVSTNLNTAPQNAILSRVTGIDMKSRYDIGAELGQGNYGIAYLCTDQITGQKFACKSISKQKLERQDDKLRMQGEVEIMQRLPSHPNITALKAMYEDDRFVHLIMELCEGGDLKQRIATHTHGYFTENSAGILVRDVLRVINACHQNGVMHRDVKLTNFLFEADTLKLADFGLSVTFAPGQIFTDGVGSPIYTAPEVYSLSQGPESDLWSAGVITYILFCGDPPFIGRDIGELANAITKGPLKFERDPWPSISENAKSFIKCLIDRNPKRRLTAQQAIEHPWITNKSRMYEDNLYLQHTTIGR